MPRIKIKRLFFLLFTFLVIVTITAFLRHVGGNGNIKINKSFKEGALDLNLMKLSHILDKNTQLINTTDQLGKLPAWEISLLDIQPLNDSFPISSASQSRFILLNSSAQFVLNEVVGIRVDISDEFGNPKIKGGDDVRVWVTESMTARSFVAFVSDLKNGSYIANFSALFPGSFEVKVLLHHTREYLSNIADSLRHGTLQFVAGLFEKGSHTETTLCSPLSSIPNHTAVCNMTIDNNNMPWFCGEPIDPYLSCEDWTSVRVLPLNLDDTGNAKVSSASKFIHGELKFEVVALPRQKSIGLPQCSSKTRPFVQSWLEQSPRGWLQQGRWHSRFCQTNNLLEQIVQSCLGNTTFVILGQPEESHGWQSTVQKQTNCRWEYSKSQVSVCRNKDLVFKMIIQPFAHPFSRGGDSWRNRFVLASPFEKIPDTGKYVIIIDHSLPAVHIHHSLYRERVRRTVEAVEDLMDRNQEVFVAVIGPYAIQRISKMKDAAGFSFCGDCLVHHYIDILREEYSNLWRLVLFLDGWDMTIARSGIEDAVSATQSDHAHILLDYVCEVFT